VDASPDAPRNQKESKPAIEAEIVEETARHGIRIWLWNQRRMTLKLFAFYECASFGKRVENTPPPKFSFSTVGCKSGFPTYSLRGNPATHIST